MLAGFEVKDLDKAVRIELREYLRRFMESTDEFIKLRAKLVELLDDAIATGSVTVKSAKDVSLLVEAYAKLADAETKIASSLAALAKVLNERDALTIAVVSAQNQLSPQSFAVPEDRMVPVLPEVDDADE